MKRSPLENFVPGDNSQENYEKFDLHRPYVDEIILVSPSGKKMFREPDLIDVWLIPEPCLTPRPIILLKIRRISMRCSRQTILLKV